MKQAKNSHFLYLLISDEKIEKFINPNLFYHQEKGFCRKEKPVQRDSKMRRTTLCATVLAAAAMATACGGSSAPKAEPFSDASTPVRMAARYVAEHGALDDRCGVRNRVMRIGSCNGYTDCQVYVSEEEDSKVNLMLAEGGGPKERMKFIIPKDAPGQAMPDLVYDICFPALRPGQFAGIFLKSIPELLGNPLGIGCHDIRETFLDFQRLPNIEDAKELDAVIRVLNHYSNPQIQQQSVPRQQQLTQPNELRVSAGLPAYDQGSR
jgi:hypothetical protein